MSNWVVELAAGRTRQSPRMFSTIEAAAPGWPSAAFIIAVLDRRLSTISAASRATMMPIGMPDQPQAQDDRQHGERRAGSAPRAATSGTNHLSCFAVNENT